MAPSMRTFSSFLFLVSFVHCKIYMSRFSLFPRVGEVNAWIEATVRATATSLGTLRQTTDVVILRALANTYQLPIPTAQHVVARVNATG